MRAGGLGGLLTLFTVLFLMNPTAVRSSDLPPLYNVNVMCDSYGVVVNWQSSHPQQFSLTLITNSGDKIHINTSDTQYNISEHLLEPAYNKYRVDVQTEDGKHEVTKLFTFNRFAKLLDGKTCNLTFPSVELIPGDYQLTVKFRNPFHVYRDTPALRKLQNKDNLVFSICKTDHLDSNQDSCEESLKCSQESDMCEGTVQFPEEQEEYCVTVSGLIRQTNVQRTEPVCYSGSLKPILPIIIAVSVILGIVLISIFLMFLARKINKTIKEKIQSNLPDFLAETSYTHPFLTLKPGKEAVEKSPVTIIPIIPELPANSSQPPGSCGHLIDFGDDPGKTSVGCEQEAEVVVEAADHEDGEIDGGVSAGYDMPHGLLERRVEISPGDIVNTYRA